MEQLIDHCKVFLLRIQIISLKIIAIISQVMKTNQKMMIKVKNNNNN